MLLGGLSMLVIGCGILAGWVVHNGGSILAVWLFSGRFGWRRMFEAFWKYEDCFRRFVFVSVIWGFFAGGWELTCVLHFSIMTHRIAAAWWMKGRCRVFKHRLNGCASVRGSIPLQELFESWSTSCQEEDEG